MLTLNNYIIEHSFNNTMHNDITTMKKNNEIKK